MDVAIMTEGTESHVRAKNESVTRVDQGCQFDGFTAGIYFFSLDTK